MSIDLPRGMVPVAQLIAITDARIDIAAGRAKRTDVIRSGERHPIPRWIRSLVHRRDRWTCCWCGAAPFGVDDDRRADCLHVDHVIPWSAGGSDKTGNLRTLCDKCNQFRSNYASDMDSAKPLPIVRICDPCRGVTGAGLQTFRAYCASKHHFDTCTDSSLVL